MSSRALFVLLAVVVACRSSGATDAAPTAKVDSKAAPSNPKLDPNAPVAKIGSQAITSAQLDEHVKTELRRAENEYLEKAH